MSIEIADTTAGIQKRFFKIDDVIERVQAVGIPMDVDTVEYHLYRTRKMPKPEKKVKRERLWTAEQIESFIAEL